MLRTYGSRCTAYLNTTPFSYTGKTAAFMLPVLERLIYKPRETQVTRVLVLVPTRELGIQVHTVARELAQFTNITTCLAVGMCPIFIFFCLFFNLSAFLICTHTSDLKTKMTLTWWLFSEDCS